MAIIVAAVALLVLLSLVTSNTADRSWFSTGSGAASARNWIGPVGANIAAFLFNFFGWASYLLPVLIGLIAWRVFQTDTLMPRPLRVLGFLFFVISLAGILSLAFGVSAGAVVGEAAAEGTAYFIGPIGAGILLAALFISSLLLVTNFTLASFMSHFDVAWGNLKIRLDEWRAQRRAERAPVIDEAKKRADKRRAMREAQADAIPPTINIAEAEALAAGAAVGRSTLFDEGPSLPTIESERNPYETITVNEADAEPIVKKGRGKTTKIAADELDAADERSVAGQTFDDYVLPSSSLLEPAAAAVMHNEAELRAEAKLLEEKTAEFNVPGKVMHIFPGPVVTTFEFKPDAGVKYSAASRASSMTYASRSRPNRSASTAFPARHTSASRCRIRNARSYSFAT